MTLLSEALAARKDALKQTNDLQVQVAAAAVRYEDDEADEDATELLAKLSDAVDAFHTLQVSINKTNNVTHVAFDGKKMTLMEAIATRESLLLWQRALRSIIDTVSPTGRHRYGYERRTKEDLKQIRTLDIASARKDANSTAETIRRLDLAIQQVNWTTDLVQ